MAENADLIGGKRVFWAFMGEETLAERISRAGELVTTRISVIDFHNGFIRTKTNRTKTHHFSGCWGELNKDGGT